MRPSVPEGHKQCTGPCGQILLATTEFFCRDKQKSNGLTSQCKECMNEGKKIYNAREEVKKRKKAYADARRYVPDIREHTLGYQRNYYARPDVKVYKQAYGQVYCDRPEVKEHIRERQKTYSARPEVRERTKIRARINVSNRIARKKAIRGTHTREQIQDQLKRQRHKCYYCHKKLQKQKGKYVYHIEHTFPISRVAGTDIPANSIDYIVLACPACNLSKGDKFPWEWAPGGRLC